LLFLAFFTSPYPAVLQWNIVSADFKDKISTTKNRSKLTVKSKSFRQKEGKREYLDRASYDDLKYFWEKSGEKKDIIQRFVTISAKHLSTMDYKGIVKGVKQIPRCTWNLIPRMQEATYFHIRTNIFT
jgi:hypothetical protein